MFRRAAATCVVVAAVAAAARGAAAAPLGEGSEVLLPGPDFAAPVGDGDGVAVAARGAAPRRLSLGALLAPLHEALRGVWAAPHVLLRDGAGARDRRESELGRVNRTVGDFLAFLEAGRVSGVLLLEALPPGAARAFYDDALLGGGWSGGCAACSARVREPGALRSGTTRTRRPYDAGEMADATSDRALGLLDCASFSLAAGESVSVPRRTVHAARAAAGAPSVHVTVGFRDDAAAPACAAPGGGGGDDLPDGRRLDCVDSNVESYATGCPAGSYSGACAVACASCAAGTYQPSAWQAACLACPSGSYQSSATNYATACTTCPAGTFAAGGAASCSACAAGYYTAGGAASARAAPRGPTPDDGYGSCLACPAGSYAAAAAASCAACPAGTYSSAGAASCSSCAAGSSAAGAASSHAGATSCYSCAAGTYAAAEGSASCADCAAGSSQGADGQASCAACAAGSYAGASGATACAACAAGTSSSAGAIACGACAAGTYSLAGSPACATCGADGHWDVDVTGVPARDDCACEDGWTGYDCDIVECAETLHAMSLGLMLVEASWPEPTRTMSNARVTWAAILRAADLNADEVLSGDELAYALAWKSVACPGVANAWSRQSHEAGRPGTWTRLFEGDVSISEMIADLVAYRTTPTLKFGADTYVDGATSLAELGVTSMNATYPDPAWAEAECAAREDGSGTTGVTVAWTLRADMVGALYQQCAFVNGAQIGDAGGFFDSLVDGTDCDGGRCEFHDARGIAAGNRKRVLCVEVDFCASAAPAAPNRWTLLSAARCATALAYDGAPADVVPALEDFWGVTPVAFNDRDTGQNPGTVVQYTVATVDAAGAVLTAATVEFTSPWLSELEVAVETESEAPVEGVTAQSQNMVAVCSKTSATSAGAVVEHVFEPAEQRFSQRHFANVVEIVDETSVSVTGYAVTVKVEDDQGTVTDVAPNEAGYFATGVTYGHRYKVYLQAFEGEDGSATRAHEFRMTSDAGDLAVDAVAEGAAPLLDFFADADVAMEFVHAESTRLDARVVGGDGAAAFATGQLDVVDPYAAAAVASCRVEMPRGVGSETRPCFDGGFDYVDEFFDAVGDAERSVTLAALNGTETITYAFAANLCVEGVAIAPKAGTALQALFGAHAGPREVPLPGDEALLLVPPLPIEGPEVYGSACPDATTAIFAYVVTQPSAAHAVDVAVFDGISKTDGVSGVYDASASAHGFVHAVAAADPNPFAPFTLGIEVQFSRDVDGAAATLSRSAIVLGVLPDDVPQTFAMTTEPTLVWTILRDPPGGASTATLEQGSEVGTSMGIEGMHSGTFERGDDWGLTQGAGADLTSALEPLGFGVQTSIFQIGYTTGAAHGAVKPIIGVERGSSQSFDFSFAFDFAVSTSEEPTIAGQASDLILGGGANLRVLTAIEIALAGFTLESVALYEEGDPLCVAGNTTYEWLPTQVTTYLLTAYEVEHTMDRLAALDQTAATGLAIENWVAVLANYRASTFSNAEVLQHTLDFTLTR
ncbi:calcium ion binding protein [Aureococcus anophagefferens]|nr:calcium ion binding protein [Aureococcus anophagefferens]